MDFGHKLKIGAGNVVKYLRDWEGAPHKTDELVAELYIAPEHIQRWKASACPAGAMRTLGLARAYYPDDVNPEALDGGNPNFHEDGNEFTVEEYRKVERSMRPFACQIAESLDVEQWTHIYNERNHRMSLPEMMEVPLLAAKSTSTTPLAPSTNATPISNTPVILALARVGDDPKAPVEE